jgi:hypothetical protein
MLMICGIQGEQTMKSFTEVDFIPTVYGGYRSTTHLLWPYMAPEMPFVPLVTEQIPAGETAVRQGTRVEAADGFKGHVDELLTSPVNDQMTHLVLREGHTSTWPPKNSSFTGFF